MSVSLSISLYLVFHILLFVYLQQNIKSLFFHCNLICINHFLLLRKFSTYILITGLNEWQQRMNTSYHIFVSLKTISDRIQRQSSQYLKNRKLLKSKPGFLSLSPYLSPFLSQSISGQLEHALLQGVRSGSATVVRTILEHRMLQPIYHSSPSFSSLPVSSSSSSSSSSSLPFATPASMAVEHSARYRLHARNVEYDIRGTETGTGRGAERGTERGTVRGTGAEYRRKMLLRSDQLITSLIAAAARGSLSIIRILLEHYKDIASVSESDVVVISDQKNVPIGRYDEETLINSIGADYMGHLDSGQKSSSDGPHRNNKRLKWTVIHAVLTGCESEEEAREYEMLRSAACDNRNIPGNNQDDDDKDLMRMVAKGEIIKEMIGKRDDNDCGKGRLYKEIKGEGGRNRKCFPPGVHCVGDLWTLNSIPKGKSRVGGSRERGKILDLLLEFSFSHHDEGLFLPDDLGKELRHPATLSSSSSSLSSSSSSSFSSSSSSSSSSLLPQPFLSVSTSLSIPSCLDLAASSGYWPAVRLMLVAGALKGMQSITQTDRQLSGGFGCFHLLHCAALDGRQEIFGK